MNTNIDTITIPVRLDAATFRSFAIFDTLKRQKRWKSPAIFAAILMASAIVCFAMNSRAMAVRKLASWTAWYALELMAKQKMAVASRVAAMMAGELQRL